MKNLKTVFTNGCFDVIHAGHIKLLKEARAFGDRLIVGLNSDDSVRRLKGEARPINPVEDRKTVLEAIRYVDAVEVFEEDTPLELIRKLRPDVLVKGADYGAGEIVGEREVPEVHRIELLPGRSTSEILSRG